MCSGRSNVAAAVAFSTLLVAVPQAAEPDMNRGQALTALTNANTVQLIAEVREALWNLDNPPASDGPGQPKIYFDSAAESLTELYQLYGCAWADDDLRGLYARPMAPELRIGYSADGRVQLRVEPLELRNPAFASYTVLLCTLHSQTADDIRDGGSSSLIVMLADGTQVQAERLTKQHPLWPHLRKLAPQFDTLRELPSGAGIAFKQLYAVPRSALPLNHCAVSLAWGGLDFDLPRWDMETANGRS